MTLTLTVTLTLTLTLTLALTLTLTLTLALTLTRSTFSGTIEYLVSNTVMFIRLVRSSERRPPGLRPPGLRPPMTELRPSAFGSEVDRRFVGLRLPIRSSAPPALLARPEVEAREPRSEASEHSMPVLGS